MRLARGLLWIVVLLGAAGRARAAGDAGWVQKPLRLDLKLLPTSAPPANANATRCEQCHTTKSWDHAAFDHDKTGFPLHGAHVGAACKNCHPGDFSEPVARACSGCHQDAHRGEFGMQCQGCHREETWVPLFNVDAHRRTNFPLVGRHAFIPCTECHIAMTDRNFGLATVACLGCHRADYNATVAQPVNHIQLQFSTACASCHTSVTWSGARFPAHDACFQIVGGPHGNLQCQTCHASLAGAIPNGQCNTAPSACSSCHTHVCAKSDALHTQVPGYQCSDPKCYACHRITSTP